MQLDDKLALIAALTTKLLLSYTNEKEQQQQHQAQQQQQQQLLEEYKEFLSSLLDIMLRGKNDNFENEQRMIQSISIYKKIIKGLEQIHQSKALRLSRLRQHNSNSSKNNNSNSNSKPLVHEETLIYAVRKKYTDKYMIQLMNILLDAIEDYNYNNDSNHNHNHNDDDDAAATEVKVKHKVVDGRRILGLALIYGNVGATRVLIQRYPQALAIKDALRGQLPLHVACDTEMIVDDEEDDEEDDHNGNVNVNADTDYIGMNISGDGDNLIHNDSTDDQTQTTTWSFATASTINTSNHHRRQRQKQRQNLTNTMKKKYRQAKLIHLLICHGIKNNVGSTYGGAGGIYEQDDSGTSPLMTLIHSLNNPFTWDDVNDDDDDGNNDDNNDDDDDDDELHHHDLEKPLANLDICIRAAWKSSSRRDDSNNNYFPILHTAMDISSPDAFYRILEIVKMYDKHLKGTDLRGRTALVKAIYSDKIIQRRTSTKDVINMILHSSGGGSSSSNDSGGGNDSGVVNGGFLLSSSSDTIDNHHTTCAMIRDGAGRLPIHTAAEMGLSWMDGLSDIVNAYEEGLDQRHPVSGLYPFVLAAQQEGSGNSSDLNTLYCLVRQRPKLIKEHSSNDIYYVNTAPAYGCGYRQQQQQIQHQQPQQWHQQQHNNNRSIPKQFDREDRPMSASVHRPLVHTSDDRSSSSDITTPTLHSSSSSSVGVTGLGSQSFDQKKATTNPLFDDNPKQRTTNPFDFDSS